MRTIHTHTNTHTNTYLYIVQPFLCLRKHAPSARCFYQVSAVSCHTSDSTSTSPLTSVQSVAPAAARSTSRPTSPRTACITPEGLATGQCAVLPLGGARLKYTVNKKDNGKLFLCLVRKKVNSNFSLQLCPLQCDLHWCRSGKVPRPEHSLRGFL